jgi:TatD DNase family protein
MKYDYVDIHTHVNIQAFKDDWKEVVARAREAGVAHINVGTQASTSRKAVEMAQEYEDGVYAIVGVHPVHTTKSYHDEKELGPEHADGKGFTSRGEEFDAVAYRDLASDPKVVAIGECGLDYYRLDGETIEKQREVFIAQIQFANEIEKPLMLHVRPSTEEGAPAAYKDAFELVKKHAKVKGNVHFFAGTVEEAKNFWDIGFSTSFTGVITFTHDYDEPIKAAPKELIHAETDAPYVTPVPHRGKRNEPAYVVEVIKRQAELRGVSFEGWAAQLRENANKLFGI